MLPGCCITVLHCAACGRRVPTMFWRQLCCADGGDGARRCWGIPYGEESSVDVCGTGSVNASSVQGVDASHPLFHNNMDTLPSGENPPVRQGSVCV
jgi:hypothetical protein